MPQNPCCCGGKECEACASGTAPASLIATIADVAAKVPGIVTCTGKCPLLNDTFVVDWIGVSETWQYISCNYQYYTLFYDEGLARWIEVKVTVTIRKTKASGVYEVLGVAIIGSYQNPPDEPGGASSCANSGFSVSFGTSAPDCFAFDALSLSIDHDFGNDCTLASATFEVTSP
jgi:hypothetical protein